VEVTEDQLRRQLAAAPAPFECLIAEVDGEPAGFALFFHTYSTWKGKRGIFLEDLFVADERRGAGIGKALLLAVVRLAHERDCARVEWNVLRWNEPALGFYRALGAQPLNDWVMYRLTGPALEALRR
jgi:GNAT superfamily N-acetyltransferase